MTIAYSDRVTQLMQKFLTDSGYMDQVSELGTGGRLQDFVMGLLMDEGYNPNNFGLLSDVLASFTSAVDWGLVAHNLRDDDRHANYLEYSKRDDRFICAHNLVKHFDQAFGQVVGSNVDLSYSERFQLIELKCDAWDYSITLINQMKPIKGEDLQSWINRMVREGFIVGTNG